MFADATRVISRLIKCDKGEVLAGCYTETEVIDKAFKIKKDFDMMTLTTHIIYKLKRWNLIY